MEYQITIVVQAPDPSSDFGGTLYIRQRMTCMEWESLKKKHKGEVLHEIVNKCHASLVLEYKRKVEQRVNETGKDRSA